MDNEFQLKQLDQIDFGAGIVTRRLINNHIQSIWEDEDNKDELQDEEPENSVFRQQYGDQMDNQED